MNYYPGTSQLGLAQLGVMWLGYAQPAPSAGGPPLVSTSTQQPPPERSASQRVPEQG